MRSLFKAHPLFPTRSYAPVRAPGRPKLLHCFNERVVRKPQFHELVVGDPSGRQLRGKPLKLGAHLVHFTDIATRWCPDHRAPTLGLADDPFGLETGECLPDWSATHIEFTCENFLLQPRARRVFTGQNFRMNAVRQFFDQLRSDFRQGVSPSRTKFEIYNLGYIIYDIGCNKTTDVRWTGHFYANQEVARDGFECSLRYTTILLSAVTAPDRAQQRNTTRIVSLTRN